MLQKKAVAPALFELLVRLQKEDFAAGMRLVGGTALALQFAHRKSTDIDLFSVERFDRDAILDLLTLEYGFQPSRIGAQTIVGYIDGIKIDMIYHPYHWLEAPVESGVLRLAGVKDIVAMKLHAIANSGERPKDFLDIAFLSKRYSLAENGMDCNLSADERMWVIDSLLPRCHEMDKELINNFRSENYWALLDEYRYFNDKSKFS